MRDLEFTLQPSKRFRVILLLFILLTLAIAATLSVSLWLTLPLLILTSFYGIYCFNRWLYPVKSLRRLSDGGWVLHTKMGEYLAELQGDSIVTSWVSVLSFQLENKKRLVAILFPDSLLPDGYKRLIVAIQCF